MFRRLLLAAALAHSGVGGSGCATRAKPKPVGLTPVNLDETNRRAAITTRLGMELRLELPAPRVSGHVWQVIQNDTRALQPLSELGAPAADSGRSTVRFHAVRQGRTQLKFIAVPARTSAVADPVDFYDVLVTIE